MIREMSTPHELRPSTKAFDVSYLRQPGSLAVTMSCGNTILEIAVSLYKLSLWVKAISGSSLNISHYTLNVNMYTTSSADDIRVSVNGRFPIYRLWSASYRSPSVSDYFRSVSIQSCGITDLTVRSTHAALGRAAPPAFVAAKPWRGVMSCIFHQLIHNPPGQRDIAPRCPVRWCGMRMFYCVRPIYARIEWFTCAMLVRAPTSHERLTSWTVYRRTYVL